MEKLEELKLKLDEEKNLLDEVEIKYKEQTEKYRKAQREWELEYYKDKTCSSCRYSVELDFSLDGWHNLCGCDGAVCTCCHHYCDYYKPDNAVTEAIKKHDQDPNLSPEIVEGLKILGIDIFSESVDEDDATKVVEILIILRIVKN